MTPVEQLIYHIVGVKGHNLPPGITGVFVSPDTTPEAAKRLHHLLRGDVRLFYSDDPRLHNIMVMRRPLLTTTYPSYVAANFMEFSQHRLFEKIADVLATDVPEVELLERHLPPLFSIPECMPARCNVVPDEPDYECAVDSAIQYDEAEISHASIVPHPDEEEDEDTIEFDRKQFVDRLSAMVLDYVNRYHEMPPLDDISAMISGKISLANRGMSPVVVNGDLKVILPDFNELEIRLTPLARTVYILFLKHPEGIILKDIGDYKAELEEIYSLVRPGADPELARTYIDELTVPGSDSLRQKLSMIKRGVNNALINKEVAAHYHVTGSRGERYCISGFPSLAVKLPRILA